jgi:hypothetical protein
VVITDHRCMTLARLRSGHREQVFTITGSVFMIERIDRSRSPECAASLDRHSARRTWRMQAGAKKRLSNRAKKLTIKSRWNQQARLAGRVAINECRMPTPADQRISFRLRPTPRCCMDPVLVAGARAGTHIGKPIHLPGTFALPFKYHAEHRHRIPKARYRSRTGRSMTRH